MDQYVEVNVSITDDTRTGYDCLAVRFFPAGVAGVVHFSMEFIAENCENKRISYVCQVSTDYLSSVVPPRSAFYACTCNALTTQISLNVDAGQVHHGDTLQPGECYRYMKTVGENVYVNINDVHYYVDNDTVPVLTPVKPCGVFDIKTPAYLIPLPVDFIYYWLTSDDGLTKSEAQQWCNTSLDVNLLSFDRPHEHEFIIPIYNVTTIRPQSEYVWTTGIKVNGVWFWENKMQVIQMLINETSADAKCLALHTKNDYELVAMRCDEKISYICKMDNFVFNTTSSVSATTLITTPITTSTDNGVSSVPWWSRNGDNNNYNLVDVIPLYKSSSSGSSSKTYNCSILLVNISFTFYKVIIRVMKA